MGTLPIRIADLVGAVTANVYFILVIAVFSARLFGRLDIARWFGLISFLTIIPLAYLLFQGFSTGRQHVYFLWIGLMAAFLLLELLVDYVFKIEFRSIRWATVVYVMFFFGATGGMIGVASQAGRWWTVVTAAIFLVMAVLAFVQRAKTGL